MPQHKPSPNCPRTVPGHSGDTSGTVHESPENTPNLQAGTVPGTVGTLWTLTPTATAPPGQCGIRDRCRDCSAALNRTNITGLCAECKLIARNERATGIADDPTLWVTPEDAFANIARVFGGPA